MQPNKLISPEVREDIKNKANKLATFLGYNPQSVNLDVINIQEAYCQGYLQSNIDSKNGGFFDLDEVERKCNHIEHEPPMHLYIPEGKGYKHICPGCGKSVNIIPPNIRL
jgi:hypothetical protein